MQTRTPIPMRNSTYAYHNLWTKKKKKNITFLGKI